MAVSPTPSSERPAPGSGSSGSGPHQQHHNHHQQASSSSSPPPQQQQSTNNNPSTVAPLTSIPSSSTSSTQPSHIRLVFAHGTPSCVLRPGIVIRGHVHLHLQAPCYASGIRVRLRGEETATVLAQESSGDPIRQQQTIVLFDTETMVSGANDNDNVLASWHEILPGSYTFPFALKVPNVNFPPCIPGLDGFKQRYLFSVNMDGPFEHVFAADDVPCQFMPNVLAPKPTEWLFHETVGVSLNKSSTQLNKPTGIAISIKMPQQIYLPGDPLSMETTLVNNGLHKITNVDIILRRTIKGLVPASYTSISAVSQTDILSESVEVRVKPGETGHVEIMSAIPLTSTGIPTFETNFVKVSYELIMITRIKKSVFAGGDSSYHCSIPIPMATHNVDNPTIVLRTPRWTRTRIQPYFFNVHLPDPIGDLHESELGIQTSSSPSTETNPATSVSTAAATSGLTATTVVVAESAVPTSPTVDQQSAVPLATSMQEFLAGGSVELHRERTLKKSLNRSKSLKDIQGNRGALGAAAVVQQSSSWRNELQQQQDRDAAAATTTTATNSNGYGSAALARTKSEHVPAGYSRPGASQDRPPRQSPPLRGRAKNEPEESIAYSNNNNTSNGGSTDTSTIAYIPPPTSSTYSSAFDSTTNPHLMLGTRSHRREPSNTPLTSEQQAELVRKASRRILPNQGSYNNNGELISTNNNSNGTPVAANPPAGISAAAIAAVAATNGSNLGSNGSSTSIPRSPHSDPAPAPNLPPKRNASLSQRAHEQQQQHANTNMTAATNNNTNNGNNNIGTVTEERVPYQHQLPANQQPPGVYPPSARRALQSDRTTATKRDANQPIASNGHGTVAGTFLPPPPPFVNSATGSLSAAPVRLSVMTDGNMSTNNRSSSGSQYEIPPWERVEKIKSNQQWQRSPLTSAHQSQHHHQQQQQQQQYHNQ